MKISILFFLFSLSLQLTDLDKSIAKELGDDANRSKLCLSRPLEEDRRKCIKKIAINCLDTCFA